MNKVLLFVAVICTFASCTKNEVNIGERIPINISVNSQTKANDSQFEVGDEVGLYVVNYTSNIAGSLAVTGNQVDNMRFTYNGNLWTPDETTYWKDKNTSADFFVYYPYDSNLSTVAAYPFSVKTDQSADVDFWASDFLWGKAINITPTSSAISIKTNHMLSRILVEIKPGNGFTSEAWAAATKSIKIVNVKTSANIDLSTGTAIATGESGDIIPLANGDSYKAMMIPQTVVDNSKLIVVTIDGTDYVYRKGYTFVPNTQHKFTITVNKSGSSIDVAIGEWIIDETNNEGIASEEMEDVIPNNQIWYKATEKIEPASSTDFGATIVSNVFENGEGVITFDGDVTKIGDYAFLGKKMTNIILPNSVISIGKGSFGVCENLVEIVFPNRIKTIGEEAFEGCHSFTSVTIPDSVNEIGYRAFCNCDNLTTVNVGSGVTIVGTEAFAYGDKLEKFQGEFASADGRCLIIDGVLKSFAPIGLTEYTIPDNVSEIGCRAFYECTTFTSIILPKSLISIGEEALSCCRSLASIIIPDNVKNICNGAFQYCKSIQSIIIPEGVTTIGENAFSDCDKLVSVYCKPIDPPVAIASYISFWGAFNYNSSNRKIYVPSASVDAYKTADGWSSYATSIEADPS